MLLGQPKGLSRMLSEHSFGEMFPGTFWQHFGYSGITVSMFPSESQSSVEEEQREPSYGILDSEFSKY